MVTKHVCTLFSMGHLPDVKDLASEVGAAVWDGELSPGVSSYLGEDLEFKFRLIASIFVESLASSPADVDFKSICLAVSHRPDWVGLHFQVKDPPDALTFEGAMHYSPLSEVSDISRFYQPEGLDSSRLMVMLSDNSEVFTMFPGSSGLRETVGGLAGIECMDFLEIFTEFLVRYQRAVSMSLPEDSAITMLMSQEWEMIFPLLISPERGQMLML